MPDAARVSDMHNCPKVEPGPVPHVGGPILPAGSPDIEIDFLPAVRAGLDMCLCAAGGPDPINKGCGTVFFNGMPAVRKDDTTAHGGVIVGGSTSVEIGVVGDGVVVAVPKGAALGSGKLESGGQDKKEKEERDKKEKEERDKKEKEERDKKEKAKGVTADFQLVDPRDLAIGSNPTFRCCSWDPDTGGSQEIPNPISVPSRKWTLSGDGIYPNIATTRNQVEWEVKLLGNIPEGRETAPITVTLMVTDAQGDQDTISKTFEVRVDSLVAVIGESVGAQRGEVARTGFPGEITVSPDLNGVFTSLSYIQKENGERLYEGITVYWYVIREGRTPSGPFVSSRLNQGFHLGYTDVLLECYAEGKHATAKLRVVCQTTPTAVISGYTVEPRIESFQRSWRPNIILEGDTVVMHSGSHPLDAITKHRWNIYLAGTPTSIPNRERNTIDTEFVAYAGGLSTRAAQVEVTLSVVDYNDAQSPYDKMQLTICPVATTANLAKLMALKLLESGVAIAATALATLTMGGTLTWTMAIPALSSMVVEQGLTDLGTPPVLASILASGAEIGSEQIVLSLSRDKYVNIIMRRVEAAFPKNVARQMDLAEEMFKEFKQGQLPSAVNQSLNEAFEEIFKMLGNSRLSGPVEQYLNLPDEGTSR